eukprot:TRINITY_DN5327_c0_g2_i1.p1 TRINITY_DN5327_c0_g2~~TRINITY_DN5327_c0_g2_i1.p1  ORF type:complete len:153 (+),score=31.94 TRINITY_DN5327_c0_g2_i1:52-510(+)
MVAVFFGESVRPGGEVLLEIPGGQWLTLSTACLVLGGPASKQSEPVSLMASTRFGKYTVAVLSSAQPQRAFRFRVDTRDSPVGLFLSDGAQQAVDVGGYLSGCSDVDADLSEFDLLGEEEEEEKTPSRPPAPSAPKRAGTGKPPGAKKRKKK